MQGGSYFEFTHTLDLWVWVERSDIEIVYI